MKKDTIFNDIANMLDLGNIIAPAKKLTGGFAHEMFAVETNKRKYAIKLLNQETIVRHGGFENYATSEYLEKILQDNGLPIVPSLEFNGKKMQFIDNQHFYVFDWVEGRALASHEIQKEHCEIIGSILGKIHKIEHDKKSIDKFEINVDWDFYIEMALKKRSEIADLLKNNRTLLYKVQTDYDTALKEVSDNIVISNGDMDSKNVLWVDGKPHIVDLECLTYSNPYTELFQLALCWSGCEHYAINYGLLTVFIKSYI